MCRAKKCTITFKRPKDLSLQILCLYSKCAGTCTLNTLVPLNVQCTCTCTKGLKWQVLQALGFKGL